MAIRQTKRWTPPCDNAEHPSGPLDQWFQRKTPVTITSRGPLDRTAEVLRSLTHGSEAASSPEHDSQVKPSPSDEAVVLTGKIDGCPKSICEGHLRRSGQ